MNITLQDYLTIVRSILGPILISTSSMFYNLKTDIKDERADVKDLKADLKKYRRKTRSRYEGVEKR
jgi:hypothetical protein